MKVAPTKIKKVFVAGDYHVPFEDKKTLAAVEEYMKDSQPDEIIYLGDFMDLNCISSHNIGNLRAVESTRIIKDFDAANIILDRHQKLCPKAKFTFLEGNHCYRLNRYVDANPQLEGILEVPKLLRLKERNIKFIPSWSKGEVYRIGKASFIHGLYTSPGHAKQHAEAYGENIFYGHLHDLQSFSKTRNGDNKTIIAQCLGCLCEYKQYYLKGRPNKWQQAFATFNFFPDGFFNYYVTSIYKHRFVSPEGKIYGG